MPIPSERERKCVKGKGHNLQRIIRSKTMIALTKRIRKLTVPRLRLRLTVGTDFKAEVPCVTRSEA